MVKRYYTSGGMWNAGNGVTEPLHRSFAPGLGREQFVLAADFDKLAAAARDVIDEADLTCHRKNEEIPVGECPCAVCVLKGLAGDGGTEHG